MRTHILLALWLAACVDEPGKDSDTDTASVLPGDDADGDGYTVADGDCDDSDGSVHPGATETWYDGLDQDCGGGSDWDQDGDGADVAPANFTENEVSSSSSVNSATPWRRSSFSIASSSLRSMVLPRRRRA